ncbi:endonuclease/exonuclease/phosphatase family protein [Streptococcus sp. zg-JUN1979]|uniref:endonuclease/exonuclease/phosphatase family protein n=1 Tax=Streptococcus sp. zg-JUN1979 TaxID=3391450 RepID=UPI0039A535DD
MAKVLTLNTHAWMEDNPLDKMMTLAQDIIEQDYDIICLQEINQEMTSKPAEHTTSYQALANAPVLHEDNYALQLVEHLEKEGKTYHWSWAYNHIGYDKYHEGVAILSKEPIEAYDILVSDVDDDTDYHTRRTLAAKTQLDGQEVLAVSVHLSWWDKGFQLEWAKLEEALLKQDLPVIIMGDFNNPYDESGYRRILESQLQLKDSHTDAQKVVGDYTIKADIDGWEGNSANLKVDYIFTNLACRIKVSEIVFDGGSLPVVSDHFGIRASWQRSLV